MNVTDIDIHLKPSENDSLVMSAIVVAVFLIVVILGIFLIIYHRNTNGQDTIARVEISTYTTDVCESPSIHVEDSICGSGTDVEAVSIVSNEPLYTDDNVEIIYKFCRVVN